MISVKKQWGSNLPTIEEIHLEWRKHDCEYEGRTCKECNNKHCPLNKDYIEEKSAIN